MSRKDQFTPSAINWAALTLVVWTDKWYDEDPDTGREYATPMSIFVMPENAPALMADWTTSNVMDKLAQHCRVLGLNGEPTHCGVCGHSLHYGHVLLNLTTLEGVVVGSDCLEIYEQVVAGALPAQYEARRQLQVRQTATRRERALANIIAPRLTPEVFALVQASTHHIITDIVDKAGRYQNISDAQLALIAQIATNEVARNAEAAEAEARRQAAIANGATLALGTNHIVGTVLRIKETEGYYGTTYKAIVEDDKGCKIYVTQFQAKRYIAEGSDESAGAQLEKKTNRLFVKEAISEGQRVSFTCEVDKISDRDELFGFAKRPTKGLILQTEAA